MRWGRPEPCRENLVPRLVCYGMTGNDLLDEHQVFGGGLSRRRISCLG